MKKTHLTTNHKKRIKKVQIAHTPLVSLCPPPEEEFPGAGSAEPRPGRRSLAPGSSLRDGKHAKY